MADKKGDVMSELRKITECCICRETFTDPRMLPCIHTFCLKCIRETGSQTNKKPGDQMPCPLCRTEFTIPAKGWTDLKKNIFVVEVTNISKADEKSKVLCDICKAESEEISSATTYCVECRDNLCDSCAREHTRQKLSRDHRLVGSASMEKETEDAEKNLSSICREHPTKQLDVFCSDCKTVACVLCLIENHQGHKCSDVGKAAGEFRKQIGDDLDRVSAYSGRCSQKKEDLETLTSDFLGSIEMMEFEIVTRREELKWLVDEHARCLLFELLRIKMKRLRKMEILKEEMDRNLSIMDSFKTYGNELKSKGTPVDICRTVNDFHLRADELKRLHESQMQFELPSFKVRFVKSQLLEQIPSTVNNIVGEITGPDISLLLIGEIQLSRSTAGIAKLQNEIYVLLESPTTIQIYRDENPFILQREIKMGEIDDPWHMASCEKYQRLYIADKNNSVWKMTMPDHSRTKWLSGMTMKDAPTLSVCADGNVLIPVSGEPCRLDIYSPDAVLVHRIRLPDVFADLTNAVLQSTGSFIVGHSCKDSFGDDWGVSEIDENGLVLARFNPADRSQHLTEPGGYVTLDSDDRVYVVDYFSDRVVLLDSDLRWRGVLLDRKQDGIVGPLEIYYDRNKAEFLITSNRQKTISAYRLVQSYI